MQKLNVDALRAELTERQEFARTLNRAEQEVLTQFTAIVNRKEAIQAQIEENYSKIDNLESDLAAITRWTEEVKEEDESDAE